MKFNEMYPSRFFKAEDLAQPLLVKIKEVKMEVVGGENDEKTEKPILYFVNQDKAVILNKTNATIIINITGSDDSDEWTGAHIELYKDTVMFHGTPTPCVRCREPKQQKKSKAAVTSAQPAGAPWEHEIPDFDEPRS
jgi:hypothetical protein